MKEVSTIFPTRERPRWQTAVWLLTLCGLIYCLTYYGNNKYVNSDPELTLLVSQSIIDNGTIKLDAYHDQFIIQQPFEAYANSPKIVRLNEHYYSYFPTGPAVLATPFVLLAKLVHWDMRQAAGNYRLQKILSALSVVAVFLILYKTALFYVDSRTSIVMSLMATMGSSLLSTMGTALWSMNFTTIFIALSLYLLAKGPSNWSRSTPYWLGLFLFLAFFTRVSAAAFILVVFVYLFVAHRRQLWPTAVTALICLLFFLLWSRLEFGQWLPAYYSATRLTVQRVPLWVGVYGNLLSASRGVFIFSPFLILGVVGAVIYGRRQPLVWLILVWFGLLLLIIARGASWWGGASFGPRLLTEVIPGLALLLVLVWQALVREWGPARRRFVMGLYLALGLTAVFIHTFQGLYNQSTTQWNMLISPIPRLETAALGDLFKWPYTQLLASPQWNCRISEAKTRAVVEKYPVLVDYVWGQPILYNSDSSLPLERVAQEQIAREQEEKRPFNPLPPPTAHTAFLPFLSMPDIRGSVIFTGLAEDTHGEPPARSTQCQTLYLFLQLDEKEWTAQAQYNLTLRAQASSPQRIRLHVNGQTIGETAVDSSGNTPQNMTFTIPAQALMPERVNEIAIQLLDAQAKGLKGFGYEGLDFIEAALYPAESNYMPVTAPPTSPYP